MAKSRPHIPATFRCQFCGTDAPRKHRVGQVPKWCGSRCAELGKRGVQRTCDHCGTPYLGLGARYCSRACLYAAQTGGETTTGLLAAYRRQDWKRFIALVRESVEIDSRGCWLAQGRANRYGYPMLRGPKGSLALHRAVLEAHLGAPLGEQQAHHICAVRACVNPDHLQPVTAAQNIAEMLARRAYVTRIRDLEAALAEVTPDHPLLNLIPIV